MQGGVASISLFAGADAVKSSQEKKGAKGKRNKTNVVILYSPTCAHCIGLLPDRDPSSPRWWLFVDGGRVSPAAAGKGLGLFSMRERAEALGGSFQLESSPGKGCVAVLSIPSSEVTVGPDSSSAS